MTNHRSAHAAILTLLLGAAAALCGCDATRSPSLAVADARLVERRPEATLVHLTLELTNPNIEPLPLVEFQYRADLDGRRVFESRRAAQATLRRLGTQTLVLPIVIPAERIDGGPPAGSGLLTVSGRLLYIAPGQLGEVLFDTGVRVPKVSFSESVRLDFGPADGS